MPLPKTLRRTYCCLQLTGRLGKAPVKRIAKTGNSVCEFSLAHNIVRKNGLHGIWFRFVAFKDLADYIAENFKTGDWIRITRAEPNIDEYRDKRTGELVTGTKYLVWEIEDIESHRETPDNDLPY